jgi:hypothetical protein
MPCTTCNVTQSLCDSIFLTQFVRENVSEKGVKVDVLTLIGGNQHVTDRLQNLLELGFLDVLQHHLFAAVVLNDMFIIGQVKSGCFGTT